MCLVLSVLSVLLVDRYMYSVVDRVGGYSFIFSKLLVLHLVVPQFYPKPTSHLFRFFTLLIILV